MDRHSPGRQLHPADGSGAGPSGVGGARNAARALHPPTHHDGAGPSGAPSSSRHRPRSAIRLTQHQQQQPRTSSSPRSPDAARNEQSNGRGGGVGARRFLGGGSSASTPRSSGSQQQQEIQSETDVNSSAGPSSPATTVRPSGRRLSGSASGSSRSSPAPVATRGGNNINVATHGPPHQTPSPSRRSPVPNTGQSHGTVAETQSQNVQGNAPLASSTRLQELLAGLGSAPPPSAVHPSQMIETPTGPMERGPARRAAAEAAIARFEAFNAARHAGEANANTAGGGTPLSPSTPRHMNGNGDARTGGENNRVNGTLVELDHVLSDTFRVNGSHSHRALSPVSHSGRIGGDDEGGSTSNGSNSGAGRRGGGGLQQFTNLFKRAPDS